MSAELISTEAALYAAGFFDGEGCVNIRKLKSRRCPGGWWAFRVSVVNTHRGVVEWFHKLFGGKIYVHTSERMPSHKPHWKTSYVWVASGMEATAFLRAIAPYAKVKNEDIQLGLAFGETLRYRSRNEYLSTQDLAVREEVLHSLQARR